MAKQLQLRRETADEIAKATGAIGEPWYDITNKDIRINDGSTAGGFPMKNITATGSTIPRMLEDRFGDIVNVQDFGAKGDGVTDDSPSFNNALAAAYNRGGAFVFVPGGEYLLHQKLSMGANTTIYCAPGATLVRGQGGGFLANWLGYDYDYTGDVELSTPSKYSGHGNIAIIGGTWDAKGYEYQTASDIFIIGYANGCLFKDMIIKNGYGDAHFFDIASSCNVVIENCQFLGWEGATAGGLKEAIQMDACTYDSTFFGVRDGTPNYNVTVKDCYHGPNPERDDSGSCEVFFGAHAAAEAGQQYNMLVDNCRMVGGKYLVRTYAFKNVTIRNCVLEGGETFLRMTTVSPSNAHMESYRGNYNIIVDSCRTSGNTSYDVANTMIADFSDEANASRNNGITIKNCTFPNGLDLKTGANIVVDGCIIGSDGLGHDVIALAYDKNVTLSNNTIIGNDVRISTSSTIEDIGNFEYGCITILNNKLFDVLIHCIYPLVEVSIIGNQTKNSDKAFVRIVQLTDTQIHIADNTYIVESDTNVFVSAGSGTPAISMANNCIDPATTGMSSSMNPALSIQLNPLIFSGSYLIKGSPLQFQGFSAATRPELVFNVDETFCIGTFSEDISTQEKTYTPGFYFSTYRFAPYSDDDKALGSSSARWTNIFAATDTISTSDSREKQSIEAFPDAVLDAWGNVELRQFLFNASVEKKGDSARIHAGVIAQQVMAAFEAQGLDATHYGLLCYDEWEDEYEDVDVEISPAEYDEEGNEIKGAVMGTGKKLVTEAGNRYGIRYSEALCLEAAYQRRRADRLEARLAALEDRVAALETN